ncbi:MAG: PAS domain S-box protein [Deltaproteobacteria bacterium]|nr:PAS domain S-box protein [Deltaproteobacteria bacterium]
MARTSHWRGRLTAAADETLPRSEARYRVISELISDYAYTFVHDGGDHLIPEWVSAAFHRTIGYSIAEVQARGGWQSLIYAEDWPVARAHAARIRDGATDVAEFRLVTKSGECRWVRNYVRPVWDVARRRVVRVYGAAQDITERKQAEEALTLSEQRFRSLVNAAHDGIVVTDLTLAIVFANQAALDLSGATDLSQLSGRNAVSLLAEESVAAARANAVLAMTQGDVRSHEYVLVRLDGKRVPIELTASLLHDRAGAPSGFMAIARDITDRKRAQQRLALQHTATEILAQSSSVAEAAPRVLAVICQHLGYDSAELWGADPDANALRRLACWQRSEQAFPEFTAFGHDTLVPPHLGLVGSSWAMGEALWVADMTEHPGFVRAVIAAREGLRAALALPIQIGGEVSAVLAFYSCQPSTPDPGLLEMFATIGRQLGQFMERKRAEDALRYSEEHFRSLTENALDLIVILDVSGMLTYVSPSIERVLGYTPAELLNTNAFNLTHPDELAEISQLFLQQLPNLGAQVSRMLRLRHKDRSWRVVEVIGKNLLGDRAVAGVVINARDITERTRAEEQLARSKEQFRALSARLQTIREDEGTRIARELHDQLGQVLTALKLELDVLPQQLAGTCELPLFLRQKLAAMSGLADSMIASVQGLCTELRPSLLDDLGLTPALEWQAREFESRTGIHCTFSAPIEPITLEPARATALFRVLQEALTNVLRHANATRVGVALTQEDDCVQLEVADNGRGVTATELSAPTSLGLLGIRERAHLLGGRVSIQGGPGRGTTVSFCLPLEGQD